MQIVIQNPKKRIVDKFIVKRLFPMIYHLVVTNINKDIFKLYNDDLKLSIQRMLIDRDYLVYYRNPDYSYTISIESNKIVGKNSAKLCDICNIVNYGSLDYPATEVFSHVFSFIEKNFWKIYKSKVGAFI